MSTYTAWASPAKGAPLGPISLPQAPLAAREVDIAVEHCALCHSDLHLLDDDWGISRYPLVPGHEVIGKVVGRGAEVRNLAVGDRVGLGWQRGSCGQCESCKTNREHLCSGGKRRTCVDQPGGLAERVRADENFAFKIPAELDPAHAAPLLCAGVTVFSPLARHLKRGMRCGIVGLGGLGHLAVQFARAMGATVTAFDPIAGKAEEAERLGAHAFVPTTDLARQPDGKLDLLLTTTHADLEWNTWMGKLALDGTLCLTGVPSKPLTILPDHLLDGQKRVTGSVIGSPTTMRAMLAFAAEHGVRPWIEQAPLGDVNAQIARVRRGEARYRVVLNIENSK